MSLIDYCPLCGEPEHLHTAEELQEHWTLVGLEANITTPPPLPDDVPPSEL